MPPVAAIVTLLLLVHSGHGLSLATRGAERSLNLSHTVTHRREGHNEILMRRSHADELDDKGSEGRDLGVAVCVVGEMARLEIDSKVENILEPLAKVTNVDVFVSLETGTTTYNNKETDIQDRRARLRASSQTCSSSQRDPREVEAAFAPYYRLGLFGPHLNEAVHSRNWPKFYKGARYRKEGSLHIPQRVHISNVLGQMRHQMECVSLIQQQELTSGGRYSVVLKLRDNTLALRPVVPNHLLSITQPNVKSCAAWGGVHDKVMALPRKFLEKILGSMYRNMKTINDTPSKSLLAKELKKISKNSENTEELLLWTLRVHNISYRALSDATSILPFVDGRCSPRRGSETEDRWCVVAGCKDCHPRKPWVSNVTCTTVNGAVINSVGDTNNLRDCTAAYWRIGR
jgi:hypothetical protein